VSTSRGQGHSPVSRVAACTWSTGRRRRPRSSPSSSTPPKTNYRGALSGVGTFTFIDLSVHDTQRLLLHDLAQGTTVEVVPGPSRGLSCVDLSRDGRYRTFVTSEALVAADPGGADLYQRDLDQTWLYRWRDPS